MSKASAYAAAWQAFEAGEGATSDSPVTTFSQRVAEPPVFAQGHLEAFVGLAGDVCVVTDGCDRDEVASLAAEHIPALIAWLTDTFTEEA